jgi:hypothetical protein
MKSLAKEITLSIIDVYGTEEMLSRLSDPFWFQAFGCALGFDWHSSGVTTTVCGALKEGIKGIENEVGFFIAGGKGKTSRKTPGEIEEICERRGVDGGRLIYASRMSAKVDSAAVQDGYQIYHHSFFFTQSGRWAVVQQGMNEASRYARRYHWFSPGVKDFVCEPHWAVCCDQTKEGLNLVAHESEKTRQSIAELSQENPDFLISEGARVNELYLSKEHPVPMEQIRFEGLLGVRGVGPKSLRALSLISELIHGISPSFKDPTRFSFAHGGKDGHPYPVNRKVYDQTIEILRGAIDKARVGDREKMEAIRRLRLFAQ